MSFVVTKSSKFSLIAYEPWLERGIEHGFCYGNLNFAVNLRQQSSAELLETIAAQKLFLVKQVHSNLIVDLEAVSLSDQSALCYAGEADGIIAARDFNINYAIGIVTADCVPLLMKAGNVIAAVHAGWRGIASGIVEKAIFDIQKKDCHSKIEILVGPCAGRENYQVGMEVINSISKDVVHYKQDNEKALLDMPQTIMNIVNKICRSNSVVHVSNICTIQDKHFHSYRRDGEVAGRNISYILKS